MRGGGKAGGLPPFDGVLLDLDGLLIDSEATYIFAWRRAAQQFGVELGESFLDSLRGLSARQVAASLGREMGGCFQSEGFHRQAGDIWRGYVEAHGIRRMPGADEILSWLLAEDLPHALATNSDSLAARRSLAYAGLGGRFSITVCRDDVASGKPDPDLYLEAAARLGLDPGRCLALEDSCVGLESAARAGTIPVLVTERPVSAETRRMAHAAYGSLLELALNLRADISTGHRKA